MRHRTQASIATALLILSTAPAAFATKPADALASGWVVSVGGGETPDAGEIEVAIGDRVRHHKFTVDEDVVLDGVVRYPKGGTYNAFHLTGDGADARILWSGVDDAVLWDLEQAVSAVGPDNLAVRPGDRVEIRLKRDDEGELRVIVDVFRGKPSIAWFSLPLG